MTFLKENNLLHKKISLKIAVVEISDFQHETLRYCFQQDKSNSGSLYVESFALCPTDCNYSPSHFVILGYNSHAVEPEDPEFHLLSSVSVCSFEASFVSKSLSFYHRVFGFGLL